MWWALPTILLSPAHGWSKEEHSQKCKATQYRIHFPYLVPQGHCHALSGKLLSLELAGSSTGSCRQRWEKRPAKPASAAGIVQRGLAEVGHWVPARKGLDLTAGCSPPRQMLVALSGTRKYWRKTRQGGESTVTQSDTEAKLLQSTASKKPLTHILRRRRGTWEY